MGLRFRRRIGLGPGLTLNLGRRGASLSIGGRGAHITLGRDGARETVGLPGSGLSYTEFQRWGGWRRRGGGLQPTRSGGTLAGIVGTLLMLLAAAWWLGWL